MFAAPANVPVRYRCRTVTYRSRVTRHPVASGYHHHKLSDTASLLGSNSGIRTEDTLAVGPPAFDVALPPPPALLPCVYGAQLHFATAGAAAASHPRIDSECHYGGAVGSFSASVAIRIDIKIHMPVRAGLTESCQGEPRRRIRPTLPTFSLAQSGRTIGH